MVISWVLKNYNAGARSGFRFVHLITIKGAGDMIHGARLLAFSHKKNKLKQTGNEGKGIEKSNKGM